MTYTVQITSDYFSFTVDAYRIDVKSEGVFFKNENGDTVAFVPHAHLVYVKEESESKSKE